MSVKYNDKNGVLRDISGLTPGGDLELGAVAQRSGTFTNTAAITQTQSIQTITFESSMPDADYCVDIGCGVSINWSIQNRTASGFTLALFAPAQYGTIVANAASFTYRAFKVYTLQYAEQNASDITTIKSYIPATTSSSNKLVNASELADVDLEDLSDVDVTSIVDGQTLVWDDTNSKWVNGQGGKVYTEGLGIDIDANDKISVDQTYVPTTFTGTTAEWNALSAAEKAKYTLVSLTDDADYVGNIVDAVTNGEMSAVTSNAVYDALVGKQDYLGHESVSANIDNVGTSGGVEMGISWCRSSECTGTQPFGGADVYYYLLTFVAGTGMTMQIMYPYAYRFISASRTYVNGTWTPWQKEYRSGEITLHRNTSDIGNNRVVGHWSITDTGKVYANFVISSYNAIFERDSDYITFSGLGNVTLIAYTGSWQVFDYNGSAPIVNACGANGNDISSATSGTSDALKLNFGIPASAITGTRVYIQFDAEFTPS